MRGMGLTNLPSTDGCQRPGKRIVGSQALSDFLPLHHSHPTLEPLGSRMDTICLKAEYLEVILHTCLLTL